MPFIDYLTIYQVHPHAPVLGSDLVLTVDLETGEVVSDFVKGARHEGSWESSLIIQSDGNRVLVRGNPSRWGRPDNLFGVETVDEAIEVYNGVLRSLGLPEFAGNPASYLAARALQGSEGLAWEGPRITRVDITENLAVGAGNEKRVLRYLSTQLHHGKTGYLYPDGSTVEWNGKHGGREAGSRRVYFKYYDKAQDIARTAQKVLRALDRRAAQAGEIGKAASIGLYYQRLEEWARSVGLLRFEVSLKATLLGDIGANRPDWWSRENMSKVIQLYAKHGRADVAVNQYDNVYSELLAAGVKESEAGRAHHVLRAWLAGDDVKSQMKQRTYYKYRAILRRIGVDIGAPCDITALPMRIEEVRVQAVDAPDWYRGPLWYRDCA